ncbi:MAG: hypothetical protein HQ592_09970 [Planctomycetes bacterium]|nr:hypothetical protein [Planctomycetota bacterium]
MRRSIILTIVILLAGGAAYAQGYRPPMPGRANCAPLHTAKLLGLKGDQERDSRNLEMQYAKDLQAEAAKVQAALDEAYIIKIADILTDDEKEKFEALMAAEKVHAEAVTKAIEECRAKLVELFCADKTDELKLRHIQARLRRLPKQQKELLGVYSITDDEIRKKDGDVKTRQATATAKHYKEMRDVDFTNGEQRAEWNKKDREHKKNQEEEYRREMLDALTEEQAAVFAKAVEIQETWQQAMEAAKNTYIEAATPAVGPGKAKARRIEAHERSMANRLGR